jgi:hypothetical protein
VARAASKAASSSPLCVSSGGETGEWVLPRPCRSAGDRSGAIQSCRNVHRHRGSGGAEQEGGPHPPLRQTLAQGRQDGGFGPAGHGATDVRLPCAGASEVSREDEGRDERGGADEQTETGQFTLADHSPHQKWRYWGPEAEAPWGGRHGAGGGGKD